MRALNQNNSKVSPQSDAQSPKPLKPTPHQFKFSKPEKVEEEGFKDAHGPPPQLSHPPWKVRIQSQPILHIFSPSPCGFPHEAPSPPLQHRSGRQDGF